MPPLRVASSTRCAKERGTHAAPTGDAKPLLPANCARVERVSELDPDNQQAHERFSEMVTHRDIVSLFVDLEVLLGEERAELGRAERDDLI